MIYSAPDPNVLLARLLGPADPELTCEECFDQLDRFVDLELAGDGADQQIPAMRPHLEGCPACKEDYESLLAYAASQPR